MIEREKRMPTISQFFGIAIQMFWKLGQQKQLPKCIAPLE
jgi:predicted DNA-binding transcriptional regulator AlpA